MRPQNVLNHLLFPLIFHDGSLRGKDTEEGFFVKKTTSRKGCMVVMQVTAFSIFIYLFPTHTPILKSPISLKERLGGIKIRPKSLKSNNNLQYMQILD